MRWHPSRVDTVPPREPVKPLLELSSDLTSLVHLDHRPDDRPLAARLQIVGQRRAESTENHHHVGVVAVAHRLPRISRGRADGTESLLDILVAGSRALRHQDAAVSVVPLAKPLT